MRVRLSKKALDDIRGIAAFISDHNPERAISFADELLDACEGIATYPRSYRTRPQLARGVRARFYGQYAILFTATRDLVSILRVVHAARDLAALMDDEPSSD